MTHLSWHDGLLVLSFFASIAGLILLVGGEKAKDEAEVTDRILFRMVFAYWLVYCVAFASKFLILPEWEVATMSFKLTGVIAYLLTLTCLLSLPLHRVATRQTE